MKMNSLSVFFPAYNEEENIVSTVSKAHKVLEALKIPWEIIVVDDGSADKTKEVVTRFAKTHKKVRLVSQKNGGYGSALRRGFSEAKYAWVVYTDSDGQFDFSELSQFIKASESADAVWGYRKDRNDPWFRTLFGLLWKVPVKVLLGINLRDADCGFKLIRKSALDTILPLASKRGAMINVELALKLKQHGFTIFEVGVGHYPRKYGQPTGYAIPVVLRSYLDLLLIWVTSERPKWLLLGLIVVGIIAFSYLLPFVYWPEFLNWPYFLLSGWLPYKEVAIIHTPLLLWLVELCYQVFGPRPEVLHAVGTALLVATAILVYTLRKGNYLVGVFSAVLFAFLAFAFSGNTVWFESALAPLLLVAFFLMRRSLVVPKVGIALSLGLTWGVMVMTKQTTLYFAPAVLIYLGYLFAQKRTSFLRFAGVLFLSALIPIVLTLLSLHSVGVLADFYYWAVRFVFLKTGSASGEFSYVLLPTIWQLLVVAVLTIVALGTTWIVRRVETIILLVLFLCSLLLSYPRFEYFHLIPALALLCVLLSYLPYKKIPVLLLPTVVIGIGVFVFWRTSMFNQTFITEENRMVAKQIQQSYPNDSLLVFNGPDEVYFLAKRLPAFKPWLAQLPWYYHYYGDTTYFTDFMQSPPDLIVMRPFLDRSVGGLGAYQSQPMTNYIQANYEVVKNIGNVVLMKRQ